MYPVETHLLARLLYQERLMEAERERRLRQSARPQTLLHLRLWTGERLVRWGNRLMAAYPTTAYPANIKHTAGTA